jgi:ABC-type antimicrobial peptide transport system permease subunit
MTSGQQSAIINTAMASALKIDNQAVGNSVSDDFGGTYSIVGVVDSGDQPRIYFPQGQGFSGLSSETFNFILRTTGKSPMIVQAAREAIFAADKSQTIAEIGWVENLIAWRLREPRSLAALVSVFAFLGYALVLAGVYGVISHATNSRLREYGIRLALGALPFRLWLRASVANLPPLLAGIAAGAGLSWYAIKIIRVNVPLIPPALLDFRANLEMLILLSLALLVTAIATGAFASRGILRVDPVTILRHE